MTDCAWVLCGFYLKFNAIFKLGKPEAVRVVKRYLAELSQNDQFTAYSI